MFVWLPIRLSVWMNAPIIAIINTSDTKFGNKVNFNSIFNLDRIDFTYHKLCLFSTY